MCVCLCVNENREKDIQNETQRHRDRGRLGVGRGGWVGAVGRKADRQTGRHRHSKGREERGEKDYESGEERDRE